MRKLVHLKARMKHPRTDLGCLILEWKPLWSGLSSPACSDSLCIWNSLWNSKSAELGAACALSTEVQRAGVCLKSVLFLFFKMPYLRLWAELFCIWKSTLLNLL